MRECRSLAFTEAGFDPFGSGEHIGTPQPYRQINHEEYLIEYRPQPGNPETFESVGKCPVNH